MVYHHVIRIPIEIAVWFIISMFIHFQSNPYEARFFSGAIILRFSEKKTVVIFGNDSLNPKNHFKRDAVLRFFKIGSSGYLIPTPCHENYPLVI